MKEAARLAAILVAPFEGCYLNAYLCPGGVWTIGFGHTRNVREGWECTQEEADAMLEDDLDEFGLAVARLVTAPINNRQMAALISFAYNVGIGAFASSTLLHHVNSGLDDLAAAQFGRWVFANNRRLEGLVRRRAAEAKMYLKGE